MSSDYDVRKSKVVRVRFLTGAPRHYVILESGGIAPLIL